MRNFGPYVALEQVAVGTTGTLFRARHSEIGRIVAVKELAPALHDMPGMLERFRGEARVLATLDDPHVVAVYDYVEEPDRAWIAEEWIVGASLREIVAAQHHLTAEQSLGAMRGALMGLAHAHNRGLVHRDVSPGNVLADLAGESKLVDFGLAAPAGETGVLGTPAFVSPEAIRGEAVGPGSDVYSSGAVLYLLLSGQPPFPSTTAAEALRRHLDEPAPRLTKHGRELADVVARCLAKRPEERPADAAALLAELEDAAAKRYGTAWLTKASIATLVVATMEMKPGIGSGHSATQPEAQTETSGAADTGRETTVVHPASRRPVKPTVAAAAAAPPPAEHVHPAAQHKPHHRRRLGRVSPLVAAVAAVVVLGGAGTAATIALSGNDSAPVTPVAAASTEPSPSPSPSPEPSPAAAVPSPSSAPLLAAAAPQGKFAIAVTVVKSTNIFEPAGVVLPGTWTVVTTCGRSAHATINGLRQPTFTFGSSCTGTVTSTSGAKYTSTWDGTTFVTKGTRESPCLTRGVPVPGTAGAYHEVIVNTLTVTRRLPDGRPGELRGTGQQSQTLVKPFANCAKGTTVESRTLVVRLL